MDTGMDLILGNPEKCIIEDEIRGTEMIVGSYG